MMTNDYRLLNALPAWSYNMLTNQHVIKCGNFQVTSLLPLKTKILVYISIGYVHNNVLVTILVKKYIPLRKLKKMEKTFFIFSVHTYVFCVTSVTRDFCNIKQ
jgi:hypothetical protein